MSLTCPLCGKDVPVPESWQDTADVRGGVLRLDVPAEKLRVQHGPVHTVWYEAG